MKKWKCLLTTFIIISMMFTLLSSCGGNDIADQPLSNLSHPAESTSNSDETRELTPEEIEAQENFANSTSKNDTDVGLRNIKIDTADRELNETQKIVLQYFDEDYLDVPSYEFLRRYPTVFQDAQMAVYGTVKKVLSVDSTTYKLILWLNVSPQMLEYAEEMYPGEYIIITGKIGSSVYMEGDAILGYGRYTGLETVDVDGISYTIPTVNMLSSYYAETTHVALRSAIKHDYSTIKTVAKAIFGNDIEVREVEIGTDISEEMGMMYENFYKDLPMLLVELENQSNANFKKFIFRTDQGEIIDAKDTVSLDSAITRNIEFSADFEHFFLFTHNTSLESLTLAYYDKDLHKIWEREFEEATNAVYDYTKNNLYIVVNNQLYIINLETGEDTFTPTYVGAKADIRKLSDGILMVSKSKSDGIMKCQLDGSITWMTNLQNDIESVTGLQLVGDNIVIQYEDTNYEEHYVLLRAKTGEVLTNADAIG